MYPAWDLINRINFYEFTDSAFIQDAFKSHLIHVVVKLRELLLKTFSLSDTNNELTGFGILVRETLDDAPVVEHVLGESFTLSISSKSSCETE